MFRGRHFARTYIAYRHADLNLWLIMPSGAHHGTCARMPTRNLVGVTIMQKGPTSIYATSDKQLVQTNTYICTWLERKTPKHCNSRMYDVMCVHMSLERSRSGAGSQGRHKAMEAGQGRVHSLTTRFGPLFSSCVVNNSSVATTKKMICASHHVCPHGIWGLPLVANYSTIY